jgi:hypothetical protein
MDYWYTKTRHNYPCLFADIDGDGCAILKSLASKPGDPMSRNVGVKIAHLKCDEAKSGSVSSPVSSPAK